MLKKIVIAGIVGYQKTLSPDHGLAKVLFPGGYCRFQPSCSDYSIMAIKKHGLLIGSAKSFGRIIRCNPWNPGGLDLP